MVQYCLPLSSTFESVVRTRAAAAQGGKLIGRLLQLYHSSNQNLKEATQRLKQERRPIQLAAADDRTEMSLREDAHKMIGAFTLSSDHGTTLQALLHYKSADTLQLIIPGIEAVSLVKITTDDDREVQYSLHESNAKGTGQVVICLSIDALSGLREPASLLFVIRIGDIEFISEPV